MRKASPPPPCFSSRMRRRGRGSSPAPRAPSLASAVPCRAPSASLSNSCRRRRPCNMPLRAPFWWYRRAGVLASALSPLGTIYGRMAERKAAEVKPYRSRLPVICIGNFTVGGGGKTPTAIAVAEVLKEAGERPCFLARGYGGKAARAVAGTQGEGAGEDGAQ